MTRASLSTIWGPDAWTGKRLRHISLVLLVILSVASLEAQTLSKSYAVVVGIDQYASTKWPRLNYAVSDARAIASYLSSQGYEVIPLYGPSATKQAILEAMQNNLAPRLKRADRVLIFFAGHGHTETLAGQEKGYIVPFDGTAASASFISMAELREQSSNMGAAAHQVFLMDSCFG